jgi:hypothetical protein
MAQRSFGGGLQYLNPGDPGIYRVQRGRPGADELMAPDVGKGGRYVITTGEAAAANGGIAALPNTWRRAFDMHSPGFAVIVLGVLLLVLHARFGGQFALGARAGVGK